MAYRPFFSLGTVTYPCPRTILPSFKWPSVHSSSITISGFLKKHSGFCGNDHMHLCITSSHRWNMRIVAASLDPDLRTVLELASDAELFELSNILYGRRGQRPSYRDVLLCVRMKLSVPCSIKLSTEDLEAEIFLHLLQQYSSNKSESFLHPPSKYQNVTFAAKADAFTQGPKGWRDYLPFSLKLGGEEILKVILKGGSVFTISTLQNMVARRLGGKVLLETARYQVAKEVLKKGGQAAASKLQTRVALLAARQGLVGAASCYMALQRTSMLLGPLLWGTFLADIVIRSVDTDYARVVRAIYAFAQIRLLRTYGWTQAKQLS